MPFTSLRPWPLAPRPFGEEAFGSWLGRIASRYQLSVIQTWEINQLGTFPALTSAGWILFPAVPGSTLELLAALARLSFDRLVRIQTPPEWTVDRPSLQYCFRCLVLNSADISAPRWKRRWFDPDVKGCEEHETDLEHIPAAILRQAPNMDHLISLVSKYRRESSET